MENLESGQSRIIVGEGQASSSTTELDRCVERCAHFIGGSEFDESLRLRYIKKRYPESYQELASELQEVVGAELRAINRQKFKPTKKYISQTVFYRNEEHRRRVCTRLRDEAIDYPGALLLWVDEESHLHYVHDCPHSNGQCRCRIFKGDDFRKPIRNPLRRLKPIDELDEIDWTNVFLYFILSKWPCESQVWIGGRLQGFPSDDKIIQWRSVCTKSREILDRQGARDGYNSEEEQPNHEDDQQFIRTSPGPVGKKRSISEERRMGRKKTKYEHTVETIQTLLKKYMVIPANHIRDILIHMDYDFLFDPNIQKQYDAACDLFLKKCNRYSWYDFEQLYENTLPVFFSNSVNPWDYYHTREDSFNFVKDLLLYQFSGDNEEIQRFLYNCINWFNKEGWEGNVKCNGLCVIGPPNSGKNYFFDILASIAYNVGHIGRVNNKTNQFALQDAYGRRMVVGNEISMEDGAKEDFKKLLEGTSFNIRVKYQGDKIFTKAPVLLISNFMLDICNDPHFKDIRLKTIRWNRADLLKHSNKKPYPLCIFDIIKYFTA